MLFTADQKIVLIGDSITDCGWRDAFAPYGNGYVSLAQALLQARYPELRLTLVNKGVSGDTTRQLDARWQSDVLAERPDWLSVMIGINDVWRTFDNPGAGMDVPLVEYEATLRRLLQTAIEHTGARLIVMEPYMIEPDHTARMRRMMDDYGAAARRIGAELGAVVVRTQEAFDAALTTTQASAWASDKIHPELAGHAVIALAWLRAVGFTL